MRERGVFLFHRDLRTSDNSALIKLAQMGVDIIPVFIFDPVQISAKKNAYFSNPAVQFMCESLESLNAQVDGRLVVLHGDTLTVLRSLHKHVPFSRIAYNLEWTAFGRARDAKIAEWAEKAKVDVVTAEDYYLTDVLPEKPYKVLSAFWKWFLKNKPARLVDEYSKFTFVNEGAKTASLAKLYTKFYKPMPDIAMHGGRALALERLAALKNMKDYGETRDFPANKRGTTHLSPYIKFGCVSIREVYWSGVKTLGSESPFLRELVFRDFYARIYAESAALQHGKVAILDKLDKELGWYSAASHAHLWEAWTTGQTGFPLVDAGMRELLSTGHQHGRVRMLCACVLTKYFWIDWREGLKFYYTHLVDADVFSNTAGWGFSSSTGADAVPYFRAPFNPFRQSHKFDKAAEYIKHWVPELRDVDAKDIHNWFDEGVRERVASKYPAPIVDFAQASKNAVIRFKEAAKTLQGSCPKIKIHRA